MRRLLLLLGLACASPPETSSESAADTSGDVGRDPAACRPVQQPADPAIQPPLLPCERTVEPCNGADDDQDGFTDPKCPTAACSSDADCTWGGVMPDADCCTRFCGPGSCGQQDGCGGLCGCDGEQLNASCNSIDGVGLGDSPFACWGVLCPPGLKCIEGQCLPPGQRLPGETCTSGRDCPLHAGCIPSPGQPETARCLTFCQAFPCPAGWYCSEYTQPGPVGGEVLHQTCHLSGVCGLASDGCAKEFTVCLGDAACREALACAASRCGPPEGEGGDGGRGGGECMAGCLAEAPPSEGVSVYRGCLEAYCTL